MAITALTPNFIIKYWLVQALLFMASLGRSSQTAAHQVSQLYQFKYPTAIEDLISLSNGCLLLASSTENTLYYIDPEALFPSAMFITSFPGSEALTAFVALPDGRYAVAGSTTKPPNPSGYTHVYVFSVDTEVTVGNTTMHANIVVPDTVRIDGMTTLPKDPHIILAADAIGGRILRINTAVGNNTVSVAFEHEALKPSDQTNTTVKGIRGLVAKDDYLYFTNSGQGIFGRFPIDENGNSTGDAELLARLDERLDGYGTSYGGFSFDSEGNVFVAVAPSSVYKITPDGTQWVFAKGSDPMLLEPTSAIVSNDEKAVYVSTAGKNTGYPFTGGQLLRVQVAT
ncbi:hypothetical protein F5Y01DRAFT_293793 [Xylaria sp. FL0043]|nr:hypothetical protein F5Y01DRAFT_293793 [Xylaria sp. FL0043]